LLSPTAGHLSGCRHRQPYRRGRELRHRAEVGKRWRTSTPLGGRKRTVGWGHTFTPILWSSGHPRFRLSRRRFFPPPLWLTALVPEFAGRASPALPDLIALSVLPTYAKTVCSPVQQRPVAASHNPSKSLISTRQACSRSGALSAQRRGGGIEVAEETSRLERHPPREIDKEEPQAKAKSSPPGVPQGWKPARSPSAWGFQRVESHRTKPLPPAVLVFLFWDFLFSARM
jgi:hypothetical protein